MLEAQVFVSYGPVLIRQRPVPSHGVVPGVERSRLQKSAPVFAQYGWYQGQVASGVVKQRGLDIVQQGVRVIGGNLGQVA